MARIDNTQSGIDEGQHYEKFAIQFHMIPIQFHMIVAVTMPTARKMLL